MMAPPSGARQALYVAARGGVLVLSVLAGLLVLELFFGGAPFAAFVSALFAAAGIGFVFNVRYRFWPLLFIGVLAADVLVLVLMWWALQLGLGPG